MRQSTFLSRVLHDGLWAGLLSTAVLLWRGRADNGRALGPLNAPAHWVWGRESLHRDGLSWRHTALGLLIHQASSFLWAACHAALRAKDRKSGSIAATRDAAIVTAVAACVDLVLVPQRLTPGFEKRLPARSLWFVYVAFGAGLWWADRRRRAR